MLYGTHLVEMGTQSSTIKSYFSAIKHVLRCDGYEWSDDKAALSVTTKCCRIINDRVRVRLPVLRRLLDIMIYELRKQLMLQPYLLALYQALFLLAYYGVMRIGELATGNHPILAKDIHVGRNKNKMMLVLHHSKMHGLESLPQKIKIEASSKMIHDAIFCPFKAVCDFLTIRGTYFQDHEPLFIFSNRAPVTLDQVHTCFKQLLTALDLDTTLYGFHSMRSGHATDMYKMGYSIVEIKQAGRWRLSTIYKYLKP